MQVFSMLFALDIAVPLHLQCFIVHLIQSLGCSISKRVEICIGFISSLNYNINCCYNVVYKYTVHVNSTFQLSFKILREARQCSS